MRDGLEEWKLTIKELPKPLFFYHSTWSWTFEYLLYLCGKLLSKKGGPSELYYYYPFLDQLFNYKSCEYEIRRIHTVISQIKGRRKSDFPQPLKDIIFGYVFGFDRLKYLLKRYTPEKEDDVNSRIHFLTALIHWRSFYPEPSEYHFQVWTHCRHCGNFVIEDENNSRECEDCCAPIDQSMKRKNNYFGLRVDKAIEMS